MKSPTPLEPFTYEETSSLVKRLKSIITAVILLILMSFIGIYFSSQPYIDALQKMNAANATMTSISAALDSLESSRTVVTGLTKTKSFKDSHFLFKEAQKLVDKNLNQARLSSSNPTDINKSLDLAYAHNLTFEESVNQLFEREAQSLADSLTREEMTTEILVAEQLADEVQEVLRKTYISMKAESDELFNQIYKTRFTPIIVGLVISLLFLTFVSIFGYSLILRLTRSLRNLSLATVEIANGNLNFRAKILNQDEIGHLTHSFNLMVEDLQIRGQNLGTALARIKTLQEITADFSEALTPDQVFNIIIEKGFKAVHAQAGLIAVIDEDLSQLQIKKISGYEMGVESFSLNSEYPISHAVRFGQPIYSEDYEQLKKDFPLLQKNHPNELAAANAILPLRVGSETLGAMVISFSKTRTYTEEEKQFMLALARQSAQALHRSQLFENARKAIQARDEFLSIASHELKTPLTPLKLHLQGLARHVKKDGGPLPTDKVIKIVETSDKQITRLARLIEDLLDVSRISSGKLTLNKENFNLFQMIEEVVRHYGDQLKNTQTEILLDVEKNIEGFLDKVRIEQVLINFLTNAGKYAPGKPIVIHLSQKDGMATLAVKDQGPGIQPQDKERIFDRFERVRARDNIGGLGLGLYISKQIIEAHGGHVRVESELHKGSTFIAEFPLHNQEPQKAASRVESFL